MKTNKYNDFKETSISKRKSFRKIKNELGAWGFLMPHFLFFVLFVIVPLIYGFVMSFYRWSILGTTRYVGLSNYIKIWNDSRFWLSVKNTIIFAIISIPLVITISMLFALLLKQKLYGKLWLLIAFVSPTFFGSVGILTTWRWIFASTPNGLLNYYLMKLGILSQPISWFETPTRAWACIIFVTVWWIMGFSVLLYLGALQRIPPEQYEAAKLDGAGPWASFWYITLPWMRNVLFFDVVRQVLLAFGLFDQVYFFTGGGPAGTTRTMIYYLYTVGFERQQLGRASAISWYMFLIIFVFALINLFILTKSVKSAEG
ncbi:MAG: multiple sugar transport system permease protein [Thermosipho sp. (in: thermotogales)]|jgi:multiple sugar transport system permease protein|nr:multiple sugar transport system permease protein [Thermosipho sp. (in: thermotogales)]